MSLLVLARVTACAPPYDGLAPCALAAEPSLTIGALAGSPEYTFRRIEVE